jgi:hypothetical protein
MTTKKAASKAVPSTRRRVRPAKSVNRRREWRFGLPLKAVVSGKLPRGIPFEEEVKLKNISATGAYFTLDAGIVVGARLRFSIDLPKEITEGSKVQLQVDGTAVRLDTPTRKGKKQGIAARFGKDFVFVTGGRTSR